jgi:hypothetical protein
MMEKCNADAMDCQQVSAAPAVAAEAIEDVASPVPKPSAGGSPAAINPTQESDRIEDSDKEGAKAPPHPIGSATPPALLQ